MGKLSEAGFMGFIGFMGLGNCLNARYYEGSFGRVRFSRKSRKRDCRGLRR